jgi:hypothetical protein
LWGCGDKGGKISNSRAVWIIWWDPSLRKRKRKKSEAAPQQLDKKNKI